MRLLVGQLDVAADREAAALLAAAVRGLHDARAAAGDDRVALPRRAAGRSRAPTRSAGSPSADARRAEDRDRRADPGERVEAFDELAQDPQRAPRIGVEECRTRLDGARNRSSSVRPGKRSGWRASFSSARGPIKAADRPCAAVFEGRGTGRTCGVGLGRGLRLGRGRRIGGRSGGHRANDAIARIKPCVPSASIGLTIISRVDMGRCAPMLDATKEAALSARRSPSSDGLGVGCGDRRRTSLARCLRRHIVMGCATADIRVTASRATSSTPPRRCPP